MFTIHSTRVRLCAVFFVLLFSSIAFAGEPKVEVCHAPPGNTANIHTITIKASALATHMAHGDLAGACNAICAQLCDDGNACTIDDTGDCEQNGCPVDRLPVDCSDNNLCTDDVCIPSGEDAGCSNPVSVICEPIDLCTANTCDPLQGSCEATPVVCGDGESCNPDNGMCESDSSGTLNICPCFGGTTTEEKLATLAGIGTIISSSCGDDFEGISGLTAADYTNGNLACSGTDCSFSANPSCGYAGGPPSTGGLTGAENAACQTLINDSCPSMSSAETSSASQSTQHSLPLISN